jgi:hypothetical protein
MKLILSPNSVKKSTKCVGPYERPLINKLCTHFEGLGFQAFPHVRLNVAWGPCISDIDALLIYDNLVIVVEVKSCHDKFSRAELQLEAISDYVDYLYVATDKLPKHWSSHKTGLLLIKHDVIDIVKHAPQLSSKPKLDSLMALPKKCLAKFLNQHYQKKALKYELAQEILKHFGNEMLKGCLKEIVFCTECIEESCPILSWTEAQIGEPCVTFESDF